MTDLDNTPMGTAALRDELARMKAERDEARGKLTSEWIHVLTTLIEDTQRQLNEGLRAEFYAGKYSALTYLLMLAKEDAAALRGAAGEKACDYGIKERVEVRPAPKDRELK